jgi:hypothetical protein
MTARIASIAVFTVSLPLLALAQAAPPEVDQALRARVTEFLQYHVDGNFRKAYEMVAEDTKDNYFTAGKVQLLGFKIDAVKFTDNFTRASVTATMSKTMSVAGQDFTMATPSTTTWKIENGKWVWYSDVPDVRTTPMTPASATLPATGAAPKSADNSNGGLPKDFNEQTLADAARSILQQIIVDKREITLAADQPSEQKVMIHNGMSGAVQLELSAPEVPGFTAKLEQSMLKAAGDAAIVFRYEPGTPAARRNPIDVQLGVQPLNQIFTIRVNFPAPGPK